MPYLIDGHNLIPHVPGLSLQALDDETRLVEALQVFCRARRTPVEVFFDQAPPTRGGRRTVGSVVVHAVRQGKTADRAIVDRLVQMGKAARNWTVVTSDRQVRSEARALGAGLLTSEEFALLMRSALRESQASDKENPPPQGPEDIEEWLRLFKKR